MAMRNVTPEAAPRSLDHAYQLLDRMLTLIEYLRDRVDVLERRASLRVVKGESRMARARGIVVALPPRAGA